MPQVLLKMAGRGRGVRRPYLRPHARPSAAHVAAVKMDFRISNAHTPPLLSYPARPRKSLLV